MNSISDKKIERQCFAIKIFRVMRLCLLFVALSLTQVFASISYSQSVSVSLQMKNVSIEEVLNAIEQKTEYRFLYNKDVVNVGQKVNVSANESDISDLLNSILKNYTLPWIFNLFLFFFRSHFFYIFLRYFFNYKNWIHNMKHT